MELETLVRMLRSKEQLSYNRLRKEIEALAGEILSGPYARVDIFMGFGMYAISPTSLDGEIGWVASGLDVHMVPDLAEELLSLHIIQRPNEIMVCHFDKSDAHVVETFTPEGVKVERVTPLKEILKECTDLKEDTRLALRRIAPALHLAGLRSCKDYEVVTLRVQEGGVSYLSVAVGSNRTAVNYRYNVEYDTLFPWEAPDVSLKPEIFIQVTSPSSISIHC